MLWRKRSKLYEQVRLVRHPFAKASAPAQVTVDYRREAAVLALEFATHEDNDGIVWPPLAEARRTDDLWQTTCFEVFAKTDDSYWEYNLSPSGAWATYRFDGYRTGMRPAAEFVVSSGMRFEAYSGLLLAQLILPPNTTRLGLSAVIEGTDGTITYLALAHPSDKPDFHHPDSFVLELP